MTIPRNSQERNRASTILSWVLVGLAALWFLVVPLTVAASMALTSITPLGAWGQVAATGVAAGLQIGGLLVALALGKLVPGWRNLRLVSLVLLLAAGWLALSGVIQAALPDALHRTNAWRPALQLLVGIPYLLGMGAALAGRMRGCSLPGCWRKMGLAGTGSLGWGLAAGALVTIPWLLLGALGDARESAAIVLQALTTGVLTELLWRGLALYLLQGLARRRWAAGLLGVALYLGYEMTTVLPAGDWAALGRAAWLLPLALLVTELRFRSGKDRAGIWGAVAVHTLYRALPPLFVDPRLSFETTHWLARASMPLLALAAGLVLVLGRLLLASHLSPSRWRSTLAAAAAWTLALGLYLLLGVPGFANDGYLIILKEQVNPADLDRAALYATLVEAAERSQAELRTELEGMGLDYRPYYLVNMIRVDNTTRGMEFFTGRPEVELVQRNPNVRRYPVRWPAGYPPGEPAGIPWGVDAIDAEKVWQLGITGRGIVIAGQDSGIDWQHPELKDSYRGWDGRSADHDGNWHDAWDHRPDPFDDDNHGTHTIGTAVGNTVGVAPDAQWMGCRNMRYGIGNPGSYVECMEFFFAPYPHGGDPFRDGEPNLAPQVVNNSWGCPPEEGCTTPEPIHTALDVLRAAGILMVVSAGNEGPACSTVWLPSSEDAALSVGATTPAGEVVFFSSRGPAKAGLLKPEVVAPGVNVVSSTPGGGFGTADGTSMAGPHVAGLVALVWSANPALAGEIEQTEQIIQRTAEPHRVAAVCPSDGAPCACGQDQPGQVPNNVYGYGLVNALAAVQAALEWED